MTNYKPYSVEWTRKRYLKEAIEKYFEDDVDVDNIINDISNILEESICFYVERANKLQEVLDGLKSST